MSYEPRFNRYPVEYWFNLRMQGNDEERWNAVDAIRHVCEPTISVPLMLDTIKTDSYSRARGLAAHALYDLAVDSPEQIPADVYPQLIAAVQDPDPGVRTQVEELLKELNLGKS